jgi:hypothetical protein
MGVGKASVFLGSFFVVRSSYRCTGLIGSNGLDFELLEAVREVANEKIKE